MSCKLVNLTEQLVVRELEDLLATCPPDIRQAVSSTPNGRQMLMAYVLNRIDNRYVIFAQNQDSSPIDHDTLKYLLEERIRIEALIYDSLLQIFEGGFTPHSVCPNANPATHSVVKDLEFAYQC